MPGAVQEADRNAAKSGRTRVLIFAEAVTLAHMARPAVLARTLAAAGDDYEVHLAHCSRYRALLGELPVTEHQIDSVTPAQFMEALARGRPLYDLATLDGYVEQDQRVIEDVTPDVIVGDFRLSLSVSARLAQLPYIAISNAYWSPQCRQVYTVPDLPFTRVLGPGLGQALFSLVRPMAFAQHCIPMNRLRRRYGLPSLGFKLGEVYTNADLTLYADVPQMYQMEDLPLNHRFIGPATWSPALPLPTWWPDLPRDKPLVYVTLGSSGQAAALPRVLQALSGMDVTAMVSTAGAPLPAAPANAYLAEYLPGEEAAALADLVICNGGSPTAHQALARGVPVLGLAGNLDQFLSMGAVVGAGAGRVLRAASASAAEIARESDALLWDDTCRAAAGQVANWFSNFDVSELFPRIIKEIDVS